MQPIPTNLITGFLGVGKTTAVIELLKRKTPKERWAVLVNEYGEVGIDGAMIEGESPGEGGVSVREVAGGCVCCTSAPYLPVALYMLLQEGRPDRILIETTGLGHPARLLEMLRSPDYIDRIDLRSTLGLVAPADFRCPGMFDNPVFMDQVHMADLLVLTKSDTVSQDVILEYQAWANSLFPPKLLIAATSHGVIDPAWLDILPTHERLPLYSDAHLANTNHAHAEEQETLQLPSKGKPVRYESPKQTANARSACGWLFSRADVFCENKLLALISQADFQRAKGVFRVEDEWISINKSGQEIAIKCSAYRRDSRVELFSETATWDDIEQALLGCLLQKSDNNLTHSQTQTTDSQVTHG